MSWADDSESGEGEVATVAIIIAKQAGDQNLFSVVPCGFPSL